MGIERSLVIFKPDAKIRGLVAPLQDRVETERMRIALMYPTDMRISEDALREHYAHIPGKYGQGVLDRILTYFRKGDIIVAMVEGRDVVDRLRVLCGESACPTRCDPRSLRGMYGIDSMDRASAEGRAVENLIHSSDSVEAATREVDIWFKRFVPPYHPGLLD